MSKFTFEVRHTTSVTRQYATEYTGTIRTTMTITGPSEAHCDRAFDQLNEEWIAEVNQSFADDRFDSLLGWAKERADDCKIEDASLTMTTPNQLDTPEEVNQ